MARTGRPPHVPTDKDRHYVRSLSAYGLTEEDIAKILGISRSTLRKHYKRELEIAFPMANAKAAERLHTFIEGKAGGPKEWLNASMFRLRTKGGWRDETRHLHGGDPASPPIDHNHTHKLDTSGLTPDEREIIRGILKRRLEEPE